MPKITDINQFRSRRLPMAPTLRDSGALFWKEPRADATAEVLRALPDEEMAAVLIKGLFAIYHLSREHAKLPRKVPDYLYDFARQFEEPIIPIAEVLYGHFFHEGPFHSGDDIPDDLFELGMGTARNADSCIHHVLRLHAFLAAFVDDAAQARRIPHRLLSTAARQRSAYILLPLFEGCRQWLLDRQRMKLVNRLDGILVVAGPTDRVQDNFLVHVDEYNRGQFMTKQNEAQRIQNLFDDLDRQPKDPFPKSGKPEATDKHGVYVLRSAKGFVVHVGRTYRGKRGINQRLGNHLSAASSFTKIHLKGKGSDLREGYTYQYLPVSDDRERALLEYLATAHHCPVHLGVHTAKAKIVKQRSTLKKT